MLFIREKNNIMWAWPRTSGRVFTGISKIGMPRPETASAFI
jgi:hypothetical protein